MNKETMVKLQLQTIELEKLLMRNLTEAEINYLSTHTQDEFISDYLGFDEETISNLKEIQSLISKTITPDEQLHRTCDDSDFFTESKEDFDEVSDSDDLFTQSNVEWKINPKQFLKSIKQELQVILARELCKNIPIPIDKMDLNEDQLGEEVPDSECGEITYESEIYNLFPKSAVNWLNELTSQQIKDAIDEAIDTIFDSKSEDLAIKPQAFFYDDEVAGESLDIVKDKVIVKFAEILAKYKECELPDDEIQSEVIDYLTKCDYKFKSINNKIYLV